ncbi:MAG: hypothetical protein AAB919_03615 [Patescibacteria group bacterium]
MLTFGAVLVGGCFKAEDGGLYQKWWGTDEVGYLLTETGPGVYKIEFEKGAKWLALKLKCTMLGEVQVFEEE